MGLKSVVLKSVARALRLSGLPTAVLRANRSRATIVFYHDPEPECFEAHLRYLREHFHFVTFDAVVDAVATGDWSTLPPNALAFTFDDGHRGNHRLLPIFRRYEIRPLIYLCSRIVATHNGFWVNEDIDPFPLKRIRWAAQSVCLSSSGVFRNECSHHVCSRPVLSAACTTENDFPPKPEVTLLPIASPRGF